MQVTERSVRYSFGIWIYECMNECLRFIQLFDHSSKFRRNPYGRVLRTIFPIELKFRPIHLFLLFIISFSFTSAQVYPDPVVDSLLKSGIEKILLQEYDLAKKDFVILEKKFPQIPFGKIYLSAFEIAKASDLAIPYNYNFIYQNLETAGEQAENLIDNDENNIWNYYFLALAKGYEAYFNALNRDWLSAFGGGISSVNIFEHCIEINPGFHESLIAIGTYKYWKSKETQFIPFMKDEREEGIQLLERAVKNSSYNSYLAIHSLIWIYIDKRESEKAVELAESILVKYPGSRFFRFGLARAYEDIDLRKAIDEYYKIFNSFSEKQKPNRYNEILLKHLIAQQYNKLGEQSKALELCNEILSVKNLTEFENKKLEERLERVKKLQKELQSPSQSNK